MGRENLEQSVYFCDRVFGMSLAVWIPTSTRFLIQFESQGCVSVDLDKSYVQYPSTAKTHVEKVLERSKAPHRYYSPQQPAGTDSLLVDDDWSMVACPRVISDQSGRIGLGHIGPKVRGIVKHAPFPVFIPSTAFKAWQQVAIFFGGSAVGRIAVKEGIAIARLARLPATIYTHLEGTTRKECGNALAEAGMLAEVGTGDIRWEFFAGGTFEEHLYEVPADALVVVGAAGHRLMTELVFGSKLEALQATLLNPLVVVGPNCRTPWEGRG
jgi:hypothetical protein